MPRVLVVCANADSKGNVADALAVCSDALGVRLTVDDLFVCNPTPFYAGLDLAPLIPSERIFQLRFGVDPIPEDAVRSGFDAVYMQGCAIGLPYADRYSVFYDVNVYDELIRVLKRDGLLIIMTDGPVYDGRGEDVIPTILAYFDEVKRLQWTRVFRIKRDAASGGGSATGAGRKKGASYVKTARKHVDAKGCERVVYLRGGASYVRRKSPGTGKMVFCRV